jgi:glycosyltransferase involved in cell wall biosynthesis
MSTVHPASDARIFEKECRSLARSGFEVVLIAAGDSDRTVDGVRIRAIPKAGGRFARMSLSVLRALAAALDERARIYHFHDPELLSAGIALRAMGRAVVYDVHEDLPKQIMGKFYLPPLLRASIARAGDIVERSAARLMSAVVAATPIIAERFPGRATVIMNLPIVETFQVSGRPYPERGPMFVYVGAISIDRGLRTMVDAIRDVPSGKLILAGHFQPAALEHEMATWPGREQVDYVGRLDRDGVARLLVEARAGIVVLDPIQRYVESYPVKLFEYMAAGIPVIAADYPQWRDVVAGAGCGLLVAPEADALAGAMRWVLQHPDEAAAMGARGAEAVKAGYGWSREEAKLVAIYESLVPGPAR